MKRKYEGLIFLVIAMLLVAILVDVEKNKIESFFNSYLSFINAIITSLIAYLMYKINKKQMEISKTTLQLNKRQMDWLETKETNSLLGILNEYKKYNEVIMLISLPHLSYLQKRKQLLKVFPDDELLKNSSLNLIDQRVVAGIELNGEQKEIYNYVTSKFNNILLPSSVRARYTLRDVQKNFEHLQKFVFDSQFFRFGFDSSSTKDMIDILGTRLSIIFEENKGKESLVLTDLNIKCFDADVIYSQTDLINTFFIRVENLIIEEHKKIV